MNIKTFIEESEKRLKEILIAYDGSPINRRRELELVAFQGSTLRELIGEVRKEVEGMKKLGNNGEGLPFENSPEIYGNKRIEAYKNGYNVALDSVLQLLDEIK